MHVCEEIRTLWLCLFKINAAGQKGPDPCYDIINHFPLSYNTTGDKTLSLSDHSGAAAVATVLANSSLLFAFVFSSFSPKFIA